MKFRLTKKSTGQVLTTFHIFDGNNDVVGSVNVPHHQVDDLLRHWQGAIDSPQRQRETSSPNAMVAAMMKVRKSITPRNILRSC